MLLFLINIQYVFYTFSLTINEACHILAEGTTPTYTLNNFGLRDNCTLTALYPAVVSVKAMAVGKPNKDVSFDVRMLTVVIKK